MIYSRWRPDTGGYDVFEAAQERRGLGDDLPIPALPAATSLGVPSTECGRQPQGPIRHVGSSPIARGSIMPISRAGLSGVGVNFSLDGIVLVVLGLIGGWWLRGRMKKGGG